MKIFIILLTIFAFTGCATNEKSGVGFFAAKAEFITGDKYHAIVAIDHAGGTINDGAILAKKHCSAFDRGAVYDSMIENRGWTIKRHQWKCLS